MITMAEPNDQLTPFPLVFASLAAVGVLLLLLLEYQDVDEE